MEMSIVQEISEKVEVTLSCIQSTEKLADAITEDGSLCTNILKVIK